MFVQPAVTFYWVYGVIASSFHLPITSLIRHTVFGLGFDGSAEKPLACLAARWVQGSGQIGVLRALRKQRSDVIALRASMAHSVAPSIAGELGNDLELQRPSWKDMLFPTSTCVSQFGLADVQQITTAFRHSGDEMRIRVQVSVVSHRLIKERNASSSGSMVEACLPDLRTRYLYALLHGDLFLGMRYCQIVP